LSLLSKTDAKTRDPTLRTSKMTGAVLIKTVGDVYEANELQANWDRRSRRSVSVN